MEAVRKLKNLQYFGFEKNKCSSPFIEQLAKTITEFSSLKSVSIAHCNIPDNVFTTFCQKLKSSSLQELDLSWNKLTNESCPQLRILLLDNEALQ